nr:retrovirus-related Pol polyprotein from transposon TNT 1-94 [Tanacetum cinerariifolium]
MHNNIRAAGSRDRPPGPYKPTTVLVQAIAATDDSLAIPEHITVETPMNMSLANKAHFEAEKEAIHLILTGIRDEIYLTVDACQTAQEMNAESQKGLKTPHEQYDWLEDTDEEIDEQELEARYSYMAKIQEVPTADTDNDSEPLKQVIPDSPDMCDDDIQNDQNDVESDDERESNSIRDSCLVALQYKQTEFKKYMAFNDRTIDYDKLELVKEKHDELIKQILLTKSHYEGLVKQKTKQEMHADLKYVESLEKEIDELESDKAKFLNMYDMILQECVSNDVMCSYFLSLSDLDALAELQCLYFHKVKECDCLAQKLSNQTESVSKEVDIELLQCFAKVEKHSISLEIALQKCKEQVKNDTVWNEQASNVFRKEREQYIKIQVLKAQLQDKNIAISELKKLIEKGKGKSVETKFDKPSVVRQPNAQRIPKPSGLVDSNHFACVTKMLNDVNARTKKPNIVQLILFIVDSGCTKHMTGNLKLLCNFVEKFLGTVHFGNDQFAPILGYGDLGNDLLIGNRGSDLYTISLQESTSSTPLSLMAKASLTQAWLWHRRLSHLNFDYINLLSKKDVVIGLLHLSKWIWPLSELDI